MKIIEISESNYRDYMSLEWNLRRAQRYVYSYMIIPFSYINYA